MGAQIVDGVPIVALAKNGDHSAIYRHGATNTILKLVYFSDRFELAHVEPLIFLRFLLHKSAVSEHTLASNRMQYRLQPNANQAKTPT